LPSEDGVYSLTYGFCDMTLFPRLFIGFFALMAVSTSHAAELLVNTFLEGRPFSGVEIELDGRPVGETGSNGEVTVALSAGRHALDLLKNGIPMADYSFSVAEGESAEISVTFGDFTSDPEFTLATFDASEPRATEDGVPGTIAGEVLGAGGQPIVGAQVRVAETGASTVTDEEGLFELSLPRGVYTLIAQQEGFKTVERPDVRVVANIGLAATIRMQPEIDPTAQAAEAAPAAAPGAAYDEEVVVYGVFRNDSSAATVEKFSVAITDAISIDDLLRSGDSDVASALRRLVGVSVTDGRYAVVRGLDGRYIAATLNGNLMPSTDPFRRDVQLDLFPADILSGIQIQKTFSADLPGDTTGGIIRIATRGMPDAYINKLSGSLGATSGVTGKDVQTYSGGDDDRLGFDDGTRELPGVVRAVSNNGQQISVCQIEGQQGCVQASEAAAAANALPNTWRLGNETAAPNFDLTYTLGNVFERSTGTLGLYGTASYGREYASELDGRVDDSRTLSDRDRDSVNTLLNGYFVVAFKSQNDWEVSSKTMVLRDTEDTTTFERGTDKVEDQDFSETTLSWIERQFIAQQVEGKALFFGDDAGEGHELAWRIGYSQTDRYAPDRRSYRTRGPLVDLGSVQRSYSDLTEEGLDLGLDYTLPYTRQWGAQEVFGNLRFGVLANRRDRDTELIRLGYQIRSGGPALDQNIEDVLAPENFEADGVRLISRTAPTDSYTAEQMATAAYLSAEANLGTAWTVVAGLRQDRYEVDLEYPNATTVPPGNLDSNELLPALAMIYRPQAQWQLRLGYSATVSRPNITEISRSRFYDENDRLFFGGCESSTQTECLPSFIDNFDARAEYYFGDNDSVSIAFFYKEIDDPLEVSLPQASGSANIGSFAFSNGDSATIEGIEIDAVKTFLSREDYSLQVSGNVAFIDSKTELSAAAAQQEGTGSRDLQGQSPLLANLQLSLDHFAWNQKFTLLVNHFDDRIDRAARGALDSIFEAARTTVNVSYEKGITEQSTLTLRAKNLLDEDITFTQNGRVIESWRDGVEFSLGYSWDFAI
jgi:TonB-dependent receptor